MMFLVFLLLGTAKRQARRDLRGEVETRVRKYVITKTLISLLTGILVFFVLQMCGIGYAAAFGAFAFALNFIPNVGSIVACVLPIPVVLLTPDISTTRTILAIALPAAVQVGVGNVLEPKIMGQSLDLHPVTVLLSLMFWGMIWGVAGMFLAVPMTAVMKIIMERIELTAPVAALLAGHPIEKAVETPGAD
jgi:AI-2 transport protein TqsA